MLLKKKSTKTTSKEGQESNVLRSPLLYLLMVFEAIMQTLGNGIFADLHRMYSQAFEQNS